MKEIQGVLFDYDGVITLPDQNIEAWIVSFRDVGVKIIGADWVELEGLGPYDIAKRIASKYEVTIDPEKVARNKQRHFEKLTEGKSVEVYPKVHEIFDYLKHNKAKIGVVTGAIRQRLEGSIPWLINTFDIIVAADDEVDGKKIRGKPDPDPYLVGMSKLGLPKDAIAVVENAPLGIASAKKAGLFCVAIMTTNTREVLLKAGSDVVVKNHTLLLEFFRTNVKNN